MRREQGIEEELRREAERLGETAVLAACDASTTLTRWGLHQRITGRAATPAPIEDPFAEFIRSALERLFAERYGAVTAPYGGDLSFSGSFVCARPTVVTDAGTSPAHAGDVLMIETPTRRAYDSTWAVDYDAVVPDAVKARANLRMAVSGAPATLVWVFGDNGSINEMHRVNRNPEAISRMHLACFEAEAAALAGVEPEPDDEDLVDYIVAKEPDGSGSVATCDGGSREAEALQAYQALRDEEIAAAERERQIRQEQRTPRNQLLRALAGRKALRIGDATVRATVVTVEKRERKPYRFVKLDVERPEGA